MYEMVQFYMNFLDLPENFRSHQYTRAFCLFLFPTKNEAKFKRCSEFLIDIDLKTLETFKNVFIKINKKNMQQFFSDPFI
jgi:hypothetical protein